MTRFLCVGDLHLGAGPDYGREPGDRLRDQEAVWARALELAVEHQVDAVLFAGDAFHRRRPTPAEMIAFQRPLQGLFAEHGIEVLAINGNHDVEVAQLPSALEIFGREIDLHVQPGIWRAPDGPRDIGLKEIATVATLPWTPVSRLVAARDGGDRDDTYAVAAQLLVETARDLRSQIDGPAVLMLHWSVSGASTPTGVMTDEFRETVIPLADLEGLGFDAVVCGHIHKAQELAPGIFYTGSPAPVDFGEASVEHGVWLLDVGKEVPEGQPHYTSTRFLPIESRPFVTLDYDWTDAAIERDPVHEDLETEKVADAVVRVRYLATEEGARRIDHARITRALYDAGASKVFAIQPTIERENRARVDHVNEDIEPLAAVQAWCDTQEITSADWTRGLLELTSTYLQEVGTA